MLVSIISSVSVSAASLAAAEEAATLMSALKQISTFIPLPKKIQLDLASAASVSSMKKKYLGPKYLTNNFNYSRNALIVILMDFGQSL